MIFPWKKRSNPIPDTPTDEMPAPQGPVDAFVQALRDLQCEITHLPEAGQSSENGDPADIGFTYQQGNYFVSFFKDSTLIRVLMPTILSTDTENLNEIRFLCNQYSSKRDLIVPFYLTSEDESKVFVTLSSSISSDTAEGFAGLLPPLLKRFFQTAQNFNNDFQSMLNQRADMHPYDFEVDYLHQIRKAVLVRESEMHYLRNEKNMPDILPDIKLTDFFNHIIGIESNYIAEVDIAASDGTTRSLHHNEISSYPLLADIWKRPDIDGNQTGDNLSGSYPALSNTWVMIRVRTQNVSDLNASGVVTISLSDYGHDMRNAYIKAVVTSEGNDPLRNTDVASHTAQPTSVKTVIRVTADDGKASRSEYEFMFADARDKLSAGKESELTPEQELLTRAFVSASGFYLYHGTRHFNSGRYAQALLMLLNVYRDMVARYSRMDEAAKCAFRDVCFMIGFCYVEFRRYDRAYYYLTLTVNNGEFIHDKEYINCMVNMNDPRAPEIVESALSSVKNYLDENPDSPGRASIDMYNFLRRRKAYLLIELRRLDEAEELLKPMIDEEVNRSFAIDELAYIKRLRGDNPREKILPSGNI